MSTLRHRSKRKSLRRTAWIYFGIAIFCSVFSVVYLQFSYGQSSPFLVLLFAPPLLLGAAPAAILTRFAKTLPALPARRLWNSAVATLTMGFLVRAVINISGRYTDYDSLYWVISAALFSAALIWQAVKFATRQTQTKQAV